MNWHLGTIGFSYSEWADVFYPEKMSSSEYLAFYVKSFGTVELDTTFYAIPPVERVRKWCGVTPDGFRFCPKVTKTVTHELPLREAIDEFMRFIDAVRAFDDKLGPILLQFPPSFTASSIEKLDALLIATPKDLRFAVELRDKSWGNQRTLDLLSHHRAAFVSAEYQRPPRVVPATTDFMYVRWIGVHKRYTDLNHEEVDPTDRLTWWHGKIEEHREQTRDVWGFFGNDYAGYAVASCERFKRLVGDPVATREVQRGLFG